ncbi:hypothetical protein BdWA1_003429 [Babesia duncani]|uniref:Uncharacterized protein n=1 Tax=Babesia duncani TaxID=323732 RepID=A0AAD9UM36_9APIC|nr:hypothetical protein BdWA1_004078 [Babesia duncani]KAK2194664.1 hypothetical protein BdWA1_003870 [Babesia duncani]KAK2194768.1 hypothetical protein BdWA1_003758 [Babesia duncani]KAK2195127.1 hypothetical protein BdWA1_003429 [Babesia duncani]
MTSKLINPRFVCDLDNQQMVQTCEVFTHFHLTTNLGFRVIQNKIYTNIFRLHSQVKPKQWLTRDPNL